MRREFLTLITEIEKSCAFGFKEASNGAKLYGKVPHVAPNAWLHAVFPPLSRESISILANSINRTIPDSLTEFYSFANGLYIFSNHLAIYGLRRDFSRTGDSVWQPFSLQTPNIEERIGDSKQTYLYLGSYYCDGSLLYIDTDNNKVFRCSAESSEPINEWHDIWEMLLAEYYRMSKHFDSLGHWLDPDGSTAPS